MPVSAARRDVNLRLDDVNFSERLAKEAQEGQARKEKSDADMEARRVASNKRRIEARKAVDVRTDFEKLQDQIDAIVDDDIIILKNPGKPKAKTWSKRPANWKFIAEESKIYGTESVIRSFKDEFAGLSATACRQRVIQWRKDLKADPTKTNVDYRLRTPAYGLFAYMRSPEVQLAVQLEGADLLNHIVHDLDDEPEVSGDDLSAFSGPDSDSGNDSD